MTVVGVNGVTGMLGRHIACRLHVEPTIRVTPIGRAQFDDPVALDGTFAGCDAIVHAAGMNRGDPADIEATNTRLTEQLVASARRTGRTPHVIFANSVQQELDNPYGRSKLRAADILRTWANDVGAPFTDLVLPHVFGEGGRPFHNSVVATFCHQLAVGEQPRIENDSTLELIHAQDVADEVVDAVGAPTTGPRRLKGVHMTVSQLLDLLRPMNELYSGGRLPDLGEPLAVQLFNTLRSYRFPTAYPTAFPLRTDDRGSLFEAVQETSGGQTFLSHTKPGITRGNHFHLRKVERFVVVQGDAVIRIRPVFGETVHEFPVTGDAPSYVDIPTLHTHNITNTGPGDLLTLFWANEIFDEARPDTYATPVEGSEAA